MPIMRMLRSQRVLPVMFFLSAVSLVGQAGERVRAAQVPGRGSSPAIEPYVSFLASGPKSPQDYVLGLFDKFDIVVLAEADHTEMTLWDFVFDLTRDARFRKRVGAVFTEAGGSVRSQGKLDTFMNGETCDANAALDILRDYPFFPEGWARPNIFNYWMKVGKMNKGLAPGERVRLFLSDVDWNWDRIKDKAAYDEIMTSEESLRPEDKDKNRDNIIGSNIEAVIQKELPGRKALVIMNSRHAYKSNTYEIGGRSIYFPSVASYLAARYPGKVASIMVHSAGAVRKDHERLEVPAQDGKWDAAFKVLGNRPVGFDFKDTPFGRDDFDYPGEFGGVPGLTYARMFDGMIFWEPLSELRTREGIPGFWNEAQQRRAAARFEAIGEPAKAKEILSKTLHELNRQVSKNPYDTDSVAAIVNKWLKSP